MFDNSPMQERRISDLVERICQLASMGNEPDETRLKHDLLRQALKAATQAEETIAQQAERLSYLERLSITDGLTGLLNRRGFDMEFSRVMCSAQRFDESGVLAYIDLDGFKPVNDTYGHAAGDEVLRQVAHILECSVRGIDYVARLGGDEFAVLLVRTCWEDGLERVETLSRTLNNTFVEWHGKSIAVRASVGVQAFTKSSDVRELMQSADSAMYTCKKARSENDQLHYVS